jgi:hypothetical protein
MDDKVVRMAWDFETEPEFEEKLMWMRSFIDSELIPLEPLVGDLPPAEWAVVQRHLQDRVKSQGLWGGFLDPKLGGAGFGQLKLALMSEIIGRCMYSMKYLRSSGTRQRQYRTAGSRRDRLPESTLAFPQPPRRDLKCIRADRTLPGRCRPHRHRHDSHARR